MNPYPYPANLSREQVYFVPYLNGAPVRIPQEHSWAPIAPWSAFYPVYSTAPAPPPMSATSRNGPDELSTPVLFGREPPALSSQSNEQHPSHSSAHDPIADSFLHATTSCCTPLTSGSYVQAVHFLFMSTLGVQGPSEDCAKTVFQVTDVNGDGAVTLEEFRNAAAQLVALSAF